jgi:hypothetical protein
MATTPTLAELVSLESALAALLEEARRLAPLKRYKLLAVFSGFPGHPRGGFKRRLAGLVGWSARQAHPLLLSSAAYGVVYAEVLNALEGKDTVRRNAA